MATLLMAGCVRPGESGVRVDTREAELVFGVKLPDETAPTPVEAAFMPDQQDVIESEPPAFQPFRGNNFDIPLYLDEQFDEIDDGICHSEIVRPLPRKDAGPEVDGVPLVGSLRYNGNVVVSAQDGSSTSRPLEPETRLVRKYEKKPDGTFTFEMVQPFGKDFLKSSFFVKPKSDGVSQRPATEPAFESERVRSDPEAGLVLKRTEVVDAKGKPVPGTTPFAPSTGVLLMPFPVSSDTYRSNAVDPVTGRTFVLNAAVKARERVNACGEPVVGWFVEGVVNIFSGGTQETYLWDYIVAPQYGGLIVGEKIRRTSQGSAGSSADAVVRSIARVTPEPLPAEGP